jgi:hypothetical protein
MHTDFLWRTLKERGHLGLLGVDGKTVLIRILKKVAWIEFIWLSGRDE